MKHFAPFALAALITALAGAGCGGPTVHTLVGTEISRGTDGVVEVEETSGGNYSVRVTLSHLTPPDRLGDGLTTFVVWFTPAGGAAVLAGRLDYDAETRSGEMIATTPYPEFSVRVTAEESMVVSEPGDVVVADQAVEH